MMEERGEPSLSVQPCCCPYTVQSRGHACPARGPARAGLSRVLLGPLPSLHQLRLRSPVRHALTRGNVLEGPMRDRIADGGHPGTAGKPIDSRMATLAANDRFISLSAESSCWRSEGHP